MGNFQDYQHLKILLLGVENEAGRMAILKRMLLNQNLLLDAKRSKTEIVNLCSRGDNPLVAATVIQHCSIMAADLAAQTQGERKELVFCLIKL